MKKNMTPEEIILSIPKYYKANAKRERRLTIIYKIEGVMKGAGTWTVVADGKGCTVTEGEASEYDCKILITYEDYLSTAYGKIDGISAWKSGRTRYIGSTLAQAELNTYLRPPKLTKGIVFM